MNCVHRASQVRHNTYVWPTTNGYANVLFGFGNILPLNRVSHCRSYSTYDSWVYGANGPHVEFRYTNPRFMPRRSGLVGETLGYHLPHGCRRRDRILYARVGIYWTDWILTRIVLRHSNKRKNQKG